MKWPFRLRSAPPLDALYRSIVVQAREPAWYEAGQVPDTTDGRFDMVALVTALVLLRLESVGTPQDSVDLTERFIADMDGSMRQLGMGDPTVGKQVGHMVSALGGRLGAYRDALGGSADLAEALERNLYRGTVAPEALAWAEARVRDLARRIDAVPLDTLRQGSL
ncbi:ubiquinol-cytochrome C chaperone family protein [Glacieibacterium frigidum]|uniref:Ubiquinol-cytochrome C chaperone n=1 Tax=Glacieibacterium frigidum TaxID=2593303 RepID=A0A552U961_9SPHN|nr:ubiquinol-cytochrome C chaperone family protein [Glacieibacterium frigidum]TRW14750.1 ubiquinol-cytochrome C chaperone [Glacieibacterium frigidum]